MVQSKEKTEVSGGVDTAFPLGREVIEQEVVDRAGGKRQRGGGLHTVYVSNTIKDLWRLETVVLGGRLICREGLIYPN